MCCKGSLHQATAQEAATSVCHSRIEKQRPRLLALLTEQLEDEYEDEACPCIYIDLDWKRENKT